MPTRGRLINVSNRLPVSIKKTASGMRVERSSGGLATALESLWHDQPGVWIGWAGTAEDQPIAELLARASRRRSHELQGLVLTTEEIDKFYVGFTNEIIWPLFHDMPTRCNFDPDYWEVYQKVNRKFAAAVAATARDDDFVWVHDYHLMLAGCYLRQLGKQSTAGFFLHIPFPSPDIFEQLPWRDSILRCLLDYDVVGFQTDRDRNNFLCCLKHLFPDVSVETASPHTVAKFQGRQTIIGTFPISINYEEFAERAARAEVAARAAAIRQELLENILVLGVDRLDYTKGIPERLKAFRHLLRRFPDLRRQITLAQIVVPSREDIPRYKELRQDIELLVSKINGEFTERGWVPVHYMHRQLSRDELLAYYRAADVALITPLKDGMNLVAKEFCAAQVDERGVVIISEFAGASDELRHGAILVNPNDIAGIAQALRDASLMSQEEKSTRMRLLRNIIKEHNVQRWAHSFLRAAALAAAPTAAGNGGTPGPRLVPPKQPPQNVPGVALVAAPPPGGRLLTGRIAT
jgi:alpha,alpha-trehalose-phosphate synthase [UDP-forming]